MTNQLLENIEFISLFICFLFSLLRTYRAEKELRKEKDKDRIFKRELKKRKIRANKCIHTMDTEGKEAYDTFFKNTEE